MAAVADDWGVEDRTGPGKTVWAQTGPAGFPGPTGPDRSEALSEIDAAIDKTYAEAEQRLRPSDGDADTDTADVDRARLEIAAARTEACRREAAV
ncbi:hypothetical protein [Streptomyces tauricus]|uniref:hypothetical protein n=1 Tax=Streptomyces tauricus TaxID=68274 RepID=UPI0038B6898E